MLLGNCRDEFGPRYIPGLEEDLAESKPLSALLGQRLAELILGERSPLDEDLPKRAPRPSVGLGTGFGPDGSLNVARLEFDLQPALFGEGCRQFLGRNHVLRNQDLAQPPAGALLVLQRRFELFSCDQSPPDEEFAEGAPGIRELLHEEKIGTQAGRL
jgi:hypothetical protein